MFIKLTKSNGDSVYVNVHHISMIEDESPTERILRMSGYTLLVTETTGAIMEMIENYFGSL